jgi:hypothetical protein
LWPRVTRSFQVFALANLKAAESGVTGHREVSCKQQRLQLTDLWERTMDQLAAIKYLMANAVGDWQEAPMPMWEVCRKVNEDKQWTDSELNEMISDAENN